MFGYYTYYPTPQNTENIHTKIIQRNHVTNLHIVKDEFTVPKCTVSLLFIVDVVTNIIKNVSPCRPEIPDTVKNDDELFVVDWMQQCWEQDPADRPDISKIKRQLKAKNKGT